MDIETIEALDPTAVHRDAEVAVVDADAEGILSLTCRFSAEAKC
jgi:hypothetical protein